MWPPEKMRLTLPDSTGCCFRANMFAIFFPKRRKVRADDSRSEPGTELGLPGKGQGYAVPSGRCFLLTCCLSVICSFGVGSLLTHPASHSTAAAILCPRYGLPSVSLTSTNQRPTAARIPVSRALLRHSPASPICSSARLSSRLVS